MEKNISVSFLTDERLSEARRSGRLRSADLYLFSFGSIRNVDYEKEISGASSELEELALFSRHNQGVVVCGAYTNAQGVHRTSAIVAEKGRILGVSDRTCRIDGEDANCGSGLRIYETGVGNIGVLVGQDLFFPEYVRHLTSCGSDMIVSVLDDAAGAIEPLLVRAHAFCFGVPVVMVARGYIVLAGEEGSIDYASPRSYGDLILKRNGEYHLVETRVRGFSKTKEGY